MLKGAKKQMIVVKTGDSKFYDEAYFLLRREVGNADGKQEDLIAEANRILDERIRGKNAEEKRGNIFLGGFFIGFFIGVGLFLLLQLLLRL